MGSIVPVLADLKVGEDELAGSSVVVIQSTPRRAVVVEIPLFPRSKWVIQNISPFAISLDF